MYPREGTSHNDSGDDPEDRPRFQALCPPTEKSGPEVAREFFDWLRTQQTKETR